MKNIWHRRNKFFFEKKFLCPAKVVQIALTDHRDFQSATKEKGGSLLHYCEA